jgi:hypothetical protein
VTPRQRRYGPGQLSGAFSFRGICFEKKTPPMTTARETASSAANARRGQGKIRYVTVREGHPFGPAQIEPASAKLVPYFFEFFFRPPTLRL